MSLLRLMQILFYMCGVNLIEYSMRKYGNVLFKYAPFG